MADIGDLINLLEGSKTAVQIAAEKAVRRAGMLVEGDAKRLCPVDTGRLRSSINTEVTQERTGPVASVGTNVEYGPYAEYGTGNRGDAAVEHRVDWLGTPPHPYLRPALQFNIDSGNINKIINYEIGKVLK